MLTGGPRLPSSNTVDWLRATRCRALLVVVAVWASKTIVSCVGVDLVLPAPPVLVVRAIVIAWGISIPSSSAIHRLSTSRSRALNLVVSVWALLAIACWDCGDLVGPATLILVTIRVVLASGVSTPLTLTIHRLAATRLGAVLLSICVSACITIVLSHLSDGVKSAPLILMIIHIIVAGSICSPSSYTVHRLSTSTVRALLVVVCVWTGITIVGSAGAVLVVPASVVLVIIILMVTRAVRTPSPSTVHRLGATRCRALLVVVAVWAAITIVSSVSAVLVVPAPPVLVVRAVMVA